MPFSISSHRTACIVAIVVLALLITGFTAIVVDDYLMANVMPQGASVAGVNVEGLSRDAAAQLLDRQVVRPRLQPVTVDVSGTPVTLDPADYVRLDVEAMLDEAIAPRRSGSLPQRVVQRIMRTSVGHDVSVTGVVDEPKLTQWVTEQSQQIVIPAVDAAIVATGTTVTVTPSRVGATIDIPAAVNAIGHALRQGDKVITMPVTAVQPGVTDENLGKTIVVDISKRTLRLYNGTTLEKAYRIAVGMAAYPTPPGEWKIVRKVKYPSWANNGAAWAASMPRYIGPGINNPLGTRALYLNADGIRIHGIPSYENSSIGHAASHGCMRMLRRDVEVLYPLVPVGTRVLIVP